MSLKTEIWQAKAFVKTFAGDTVYLTEDELDFFLMVVNPPMDLTADQLESVRSVKFLTFDDGGIAISDIRSYEVIDRDVVTFNGERYQVSKGENVKELEGGELTDDQRANI